MNKVFLSMVTVLAMGSIVSAGGPISDGVEDVVVTPSYEDNSMFSLDGLYLGGGYSRMDSYASFDATMSKAGVANNADANTNAVMIQAGYKFNPYIAAEARYWRGVATTTFNDNFFKSVEDDTDISSWAIYAKPILPINNDMDVYALIGYQSSSMSNTVFDANGISGDAKNFSWGAGASFNINSEVSVFVDYIGQKEDTINNTAVTGAALGTGSYDQRYSTVNFGANYKF